MSPTTVRRDGAPAREQKTAGSWQTFAERYPAAAAAYGTFGNACRESGPLDEQNAALTKLAVSVGASLDRTVHMHAKKALRAGVLPEALTQVALIAMPTIGLSRALDALRWIDESIEEVRAEDGSLAASD